LGSVGAVVGQRLPTRLLPTPSPLASPSHVSPCHCSSCQPDCRAAGSCLIPPPCLLTRTSCRRSVGGRQRPLRRSHCRAAGPRAGGGLRGEPGSNTAAGETRGAPRQPGKEKRKGERKKPGEKGEKSGEGRWRKKQRDITRGWGRMNKRQKTGRGREEAT